MHPKSAWHSAFSNSSLLRQFFQYGFLSCTLCLPEGRKNQRHHLDEQDKGRIGSRWKSGKQTNPLEIHSLEFFNFEDVVRSRDGEQETMWWGRPYWQKPLSQECMVKHRTAKTTGAFKSNLLLPSCSNFFFWMTTLRFLRVFNKALALDQ